MRFNDIDFDNISGAYLRTTENINGYYDKLNFQDKKILTVIGSSDHIFEAILRGAKEVDGFDVSSNAILFYYLKEAAIKTMSFEEYMNFFFVDHKFFSKEGYKILRSKLNENITSFWDYVFNLEENEHLEFINKMLVSKPLFYMAPAVASMKLSEFSSYLTEENYYKLQSKINDVKISVHLRNVNEIEKVSDSYDYIIFSNIFEYQDSTEFKKVIDKYKEHLNQDGLIIVGYAYHDMDLSEFSEYDKFDVPSRYAITGSIDAPSDHIITTGNSRK